MLVISRKVGERIVIGDGITLTVMDIRGDKVRLGITCPMDVPVHRQEIFEAIHGFKPPPLQRRPPAEQAFVQDILASPDDEGIRLIFADWLDDRYDPFGEFIRTQCRLAHLPEGDDQRRELLQREQALWAAHAETWRQYLPPILRREAFERGFVETAHLTVGDFLAHAEDIFATTPLRRLVVLDMDTPIGLVGAGDEGAVRLAASPHVAKLRGLSLRRAELGNIGTRALAGSPHLAGLAVLDLAENQIGETGARALADSPFLTNLHQLDLSGNPLGEGALTLRVRFGDRVKV